MSGASVRQKGHNFERAIAQGFRGLGFPHAKTSRQVSRIADDCKIDIVGVYPFAPQCKALKEYAPVQEVNRVEWQKYSEIADNKPRIYTPLLITTESRKQTMVALPWEDFKKILALIPDITKLHDAN